MRPLSDWDQSDLQAMIDNSVQESLSLDYKESRALANDSRSRGELSKDVSAFANSAGGRIIYGIVEDKMMPTRMDEGVHTSIISREWIEQVINSQIKPRIHGIVIRQIALSVGRAAYVIDVPPASAPAPHQAFDHKYYRRFNFQSVPMEDYEIRDVMRRASTPELASDLILGEQVRRSNGFEATIRVAIGNRSPEPAQYAMLRVLVDERLRPRTYDSQWQQVGHQVGTQSVTAFKRRIAPPHDVPIYQEETFYMGSFVVVAPDVSGSYLFGYNVNCPGFSEERIGRLSHENERFALEMI